MQTAAVIFLFATMIVITIITSVINFFLIIKNSRKMEGKISSISEQNQALLDLAAETKEALVNVSADTTRLLVKIDKLQDAINESGASEQIIAAFTEVRDMAQTIADRVPEIPADGEIPNEGN